MAAISLYKHQEDALEKMKNGCILCGGVGSGKSRTAIAYYFINEGGALLDYAAGDNYIPMNDPPRDLYIITTAKKRDSLEWDDELAPFLLSPHKEVNLYQNKVTIDSWNNIKKYRDVHGAFFIFDEQRVVGSGTWVKSFLNITRKNQWILLSATPGDTWQDYIPVFIANGFYKNKTQFSDEHIVWDHRVKFPRVDRYLGTGKLIRYRNSILVNMEFERKTVSHHEDLFTQYDMELYRDTSKTKQNPFETGYIPCQPSYEGALKIGRDIPIEEVTPILIGWEYEPKKDDYVALVGTPITTAANLCYIWRKIVNSDQSRQVAVLEIFEEHPRVIIFYNFDYELELLRSLGYGDDVEVAEWNGHNHQPVPKSKRWVYLVQYTAGCEGWNCIRTDTIIFYSQSYSYKVMVQAAGRIDRMNTPYTDLYYYHLRSRAGIDLAITRALKNKKSFNESKYVKW